jgi:hypothetical protein
VDTAVVRCFSGQLSPLADGGIVLAFGGQQLCALQYFRPINGQETPLS